MPFHQKPDPDFQLRMFPGESPVPADLLTSQRSQRWISSTPRNTPLETWPSRSCQRRRQWRRHAKMKCIYSHSENLRVTPSWLELWKIFSRAMPIRGTHGTQLTTEANPIGGSYVRYESLHQQMLSWHHIQSTYKIISSLQLLKPRSRRTIPINADYLPSLP